MGFFALLDRIFWRSQTAFNHSLDPRRLPAALLWSGPDADYPALRDGHVSFEPGQLITLGGDRYRIERKLRGRASSMLWLAQHSVKA